MSTVHELPTRQISSMRNRIGPEETQNTKGPVRHALGHNRQKRKKTPIMVAVSLAPVSPAGTEKREIAYTDNISGHGVRVRATRPWQLGEEAEIAPVKGERLMRGE